MTVIHAWSRWDIENKSLPGPSRVIQICDVGMECAKIKDEAQVTKKMSLSFHDVDFTEPHPGIIPPTMEDAQAVAFFLINMRDDEQVVVQCDQGRGRSQGIAAALGKIAGGNYKSILRMGTYNRAIYSMVLEVHGVKPDPEPLVSIAVRMKYPGDRLLAFLLSLQRQRYKNWECIVTTDGPCKDAHMVVLLLRDVRIRLIETAFAKGQWGHPYRQMSIDACRGEYIGLSNDDNYYTPGYIEQMMHTLEDEGADLCLCRIVHNYSAWSVTPAIPKQGMADVGNWIAKAELVKSTPWPGSHFHADGEYVEAMAAKGKVATVNRPLFIHN